MNSFKIRVKSARAPYRRAGLTFAAARQWQDAEFEGDPDDLGSHIIALKTLVILLTDPVLVVELWDGEEFRKAPPLEDINRFVEILETRGAQPESLASALQDVATINTNLPTVESTLEGQGNQDIPPKREGAPETAPIDGKPVAEGAPAPAEGVPAIPASPAVAQAVPGVTTATDAPAQPSKPAAKPKETKA